MLRLFTLLSLVLAISSCSEQSEQQSSIDYVNTYIGGVSHLLQPTRPTVHLPNQMIRMTPVRKDLLDDRIEYFPLTLSSHRQEYLFGIIPGSSPQAYDLAMETARPHHYSCWFSDSGISTEFVPATKSGFFSFNFPADPPATVELSVFQEGIWELLPNGAMAGTEEFRGMKAWVYGEFNSQVSGFYKLEGKNYRAEFEDLTKGDLKFKYAVSFISAEKAKQNLEDEISDWNIEELKRNARMSWENKLDKIKIKGGSDDERKVFYTALYRTYERMVDINEFGYGYYSAYDGEVHKDNEPFYVDDWVWDSYLVHHPLRMILDPNDEADMLESYVKMYKQSGWMPQFPLLWGDNPAMHGFHSTIVFLDAYRKGIKDYDIEKAWEGMKKNAEKASMLPWRNGESCELDEFYREKGYYPALNPGEVETNKKVHSFEKRQSVAITMAHSYDDWALSEMAAELGKGEDAKYYASQSKNYRNLYRADKALMWPKNSDGNWIDIDPKFDGGPGGRDYYDENNGYTYAWQVQHDIPDLIELMGGNNKFNANLDNLFREDLGRRKWQFWAKFPDATGLVGQYSMGNEPSFHIPWLYNCSGQAWKTQQRVRFLLDTWFRNDIFGIPGDEDGGGMSAFVVFSMMGFYPLTPGIPEYTIGSPVFEEVTIMLDNGKEFRLIAENYAPENRYIQSASLNGNELKKPFFSHNELTRGAELRLVMGKYPNKEWGK